MVFISRPRSVLVLFTCFLTVLVLQLVQSRRGSDWTPSSIFALSGNGCSHQHDVSTYRSKTKARVAKVSMIFGKSNALYEGAIASHERHAAIHGYPTYILRKEVFKGKFKGFWNKSMYLLSVILKELEKDPDDRVEWLLWFDADSIILNPAIPLEVFLPPKDPSPRHNETTDESEELIIDENGNIVVAKEPDDDFKHLLVSRDWNGLNTGVFFIRVHEWSLAFLSQALSFEFYNPNVDLGYNFDQEAMRILINETSNRRHTTYVPKDWLNSYINDWDEEITFGFSLADTPEAEKSVTQKFFGGGNIIVHFAGLDNKSWWIDFILTVLEEVETRRKKFKDWAQLVPTLEQTDLVERVTKFWTSQTEASCEAIADDLQARLDSVIRSKNGGNDKRNEEIEGRSSRQQQQHRNGTTVHSLPLLSFEERKANETIFEYRESCWYWSDNTTVQNEFRTQADRALDVVINKSKI